MSIELNWADKNSNVDISDYTIEYESTVRNNQTTLHNETDTFTNKFIYGDNLQALDYLLTDNEIQENGGVDLIYIDPPYNTGRIFKNKQDETCYNDKFKTTEDYLNFIYPRLKKAHELLNKNGTLYVHCDYRTSSYIKLILDEIFSAENYKNEIIWHYQTYQGNVKNYFPRKHDTLLYYSKSDKSTFHLLKDSNYEQTVDFTRWNKYLNENNQIMGDNYPKNDSRFKGYYNQFVRENHRKPCKDDVILQIYGNTVDSVWNIKAIDPKNKKEKLDYPTQKPVKLLERIIKASSNPNDIILDFFAGSGTTLTVAEELNRRWIGVDNSPVSKKTIIKRLKEIDNCKFEIFNIKSL